MKPACTRLITKHVSLLVLLLYILALQTTAQAQVIDLQEFKKGNLKVSATNGNSAMSPPTISSFAPTSGFVGSLITLTGTNLASSSSLVIGGAEAIIISNDGSKLVAMIMPATISGKVSISTSGGTFESSINFTIHTSILPRVQQGFKLVGTGAVGTARQGFSVGLDADGSTALVGGPGDRNVGAAWAFTTNGNSYSQQSFKLVGNGYVGNGTASQGRAISLSADGNTAIIGGVNDLSYNSSGEPVSTGAAWIFIRDNGFWRQQGPKLVGTGTIGSIVFQGSSVSISADGNTAIIGGLLDDNSKGAAWIFTRSTGIWTQQGPKLVGTGAVGSARQGSSVAISADGNVAIIGGYEDNSSLGAAWVFTRTGNLWVQQGSKLVGTGAVGASGQGSSVSLNADGKTAIIGGPTDNSALGAAWVFTRTGNVWTQQGLKLVGSDNSGASNQGTSVSTSADGNTALIGGFNDNGGQGAAWLFTHSDTTWTQKDSKLTGTGAVGAAIQGYSVSLSLDGNTALIGGPNDNSNRGAAWVFGGIAEIGIKGNGIGIVSGSTTTSTIDSTDFGEIGIIAGSNTNTFTVENLGTANLMLSGAPKVVIGGADVADFTVTVQPVSPVTALGTTKIAIVFNPTTMGTKTATVSIANNDADENPYTFAISGTGTCDVTLAAGASMDPTACNFTDGSIAFTTNLPDKSYILNYSKSGTTTSGSVTVVNGVFALSGLNAGIYSEFLIDNSGCTSSDATTNTLLAPTIVAISRQPKDLNICQGNNGNFSVQVLGDNITYQWQELVSGVFQDITNGGVYSGSTTATLSLSFPAKSKNGSKYRVVVSVSGCQSVSSVATLTVQIGAEAFAIINLSPISGNYFQQAVSFVVALNKIQSTADVIYQAGNKIVLLPGFETKLGAVFRANIESPCSNTSTPSTSEVYEDLPSEVIK